MRKPLHFYWFAIFLFSLNFQGKVIEFPLLCNTFKFFLNFHWKPLNLHHSVILRSSFRTFRKKTWNFRLKIFRFDCVVIRWFSFELYQETITFLLICNISVFFFNFQGQVIELPLLCNTFVCFFQLPLETSSSPSLCNTSKLFPNIQEKTVELPLRSILFRLRCDNLI